MSDKFTITFDHSNEDVPVLIVGKSSGFLEPTFEVINVFSGEKAKELYDVLSKKKQIEFMPQVFGKPVEPCKEMEGAND